MSNQTLRDNDFLRLNHYALDESKHELAGWGVFLLDPVLSRSIYMLPKFGSKRRTHNSWYFLLIGTAPPCWRMCCGG